MKKNSQFSQAMAGGQKPAATGAVDVDAIINKARANIPPQLQTMFDKVVLSGMRIMFDPQSHKMMLDQLNQPGPMEKRISDGIISLMYMLWTKSNQSIPPQLIVPATLVLTLRAFQFLQQSHDPEATPAVMGEAVAQAVQGVMDRFGATQDKLPQLVKGQGAAQPGAASPAAGAAAPAAGGGLPGAAPDGLLSAAMGGQ